MTTAADGATSEVYARAMWPSKCERCGSPLLLRRPDRTLRAQCQPQVPDAKSYLASLPPA
jgi:hypothetical protein